MGITPTPAMGVRVEDVNLRNPDSAGLDEHLGKKVAETTEMYAACFKALADGTRCRSSRCWPGPAPRRIPLRPEHGPPRSREGLILSEVIALLTPSMRTRSLASADVADCGSIPVEPRKSNASARPM